jgi:hypothetical protein
MEHEFCCFSMTRQKAEQLLDQPQQTVPIYQTVQALLESNEAILEKFFVVKSSSQQVALLQEGRAVFYPAESPSLLSLDDHHSSAPMEPPNLGLSAKIVPVLFPNAPMVDLSVDLSLVSDLRGLLPGWRANAFICSSVLERRSIQTKLVAALGEQTLLGTLNRVTHPGMDQPVDSDRVWLVFVKTTLSDP